MKILFVINTLGRAGAETALLELLRELEHTEYEISLYVMLGQGELIDQLPKKVKLLNHHYHPSSVLTSRGRAILGKTVLASFFRNGHLVRKAGVFLANAREMKKTKNIQLDKLCWRIVSDGSTALTETYDLAVAYLEGAATYFVADHVKAVKKAAFLHVDYGKAGYTRELDQGCYRVYDRIFAVSKEVQDAFLDMYPEYKHKMRIFHNLINQERIRTLAKEKGGFSDNFSGYRILTVGRLTFQKSLDLAIPALNILKKEGCNVRWYVLGEGDQRAALEKQIAALKLTDDFILLGSSDNPYPYYVQCDLYVHATRYEGKSIAVQEAQTLGCAILASDCSGNREQIIDGIDGRFCLLTPEGIASGIQDLLYDKAQRERLGKAAAQRTFDSGEELLQLLELLDSSGRSRE